MMNDYQRRILKEATKFGGFSISQNDKIAKLINEAPSLSTQIDSTIFGYSKQQFETKMRQLLSGMGFEKGISKMDISGKKMVLHFANAAKARDFTITFNGLTKRQSKGSPATINTSFDKIKAPAGTNAVVTVDFSMLKTEELEKEEYLFIMLESLCAEEKEEVEVSEAVNIGTNAYQIQRSGSNWEVWRLSYSQGSVRFPDGRKGTKLRDNFKSRDEAMAYAKKDAGVKEETDIEEGVRIMTGAETMIKNVGGSTMVSSFRKIKSALSAKPVGSVIVLFTEKDPEQYEIKMYDPKDFQDMVKGLTKKADAKVGSKGSWSDGEVTVIGIKEDVEQVDETWKSLKKTKANLDAIRKTGKRVVVRHGEGDTLYKVLPPKKAVKEEVEITDEGAGAPPSKSQLKKSIAWLQSLLKDPKKLAKSGLDVQDAKDNLAAALDMLDFANQKYKVKEEVNDESNTEDDDIEEVNETWKSLKKTKVDLNAIRASGKRVIVQHGEGDTLYKVLPAKTKKKAFGEETIEESKARAEFDKIRTNGLLSRAMWMKRNNKSDSSIAAWWKQQDPELRKIASNARWWKTKYPELLKIIGEGVEQIEEMHKAGDKVKVPHKGKMVSGKIVRFDGGGRVAGVTDKARQHGGAYVVDVGEYASILVPAHDIRVVKEAQAHPDEKVLGKFYEKTGKQAFEYRISQDSWGKSHGYPHEVCVSRKDYKSRGDWRAANVKGTVCHIVTDEGEGGKPVVEKWTITRHVKYVKAEGVEADVEVLREATPMQKQADFIKNLPAAAVKDIRTLKLPSMKGGVPQNITMDKMSKLTNILKKYNVKLFNNSDYQSAVVIMQWFHTVHKEEVEVAEQSREKEEVELDEIITPARQSVIDREKKKASDELMHGKTSAERDKAYARGSRLNYFELVHKYGRKSETQGSPYQVDKREHKKWRKIEREREREMKKEASGEDSADRTTVEQNNELIAEAYITTEMIAEIRNQLKKKFPNFKFEVRRSPGGYGSIDIFIISGPVKFRDTDGDINHYHIQNYNNNSILKKMLDVINYKNWDRSDISTDYFDVGYYVHLYQGRDTWSGSKRTTKPYFIKNADKKSVRESVENESKIDHIDEYSNAISEASNITPEQAMETAKSIVSKAKELKVTVSSDGGSVVTCTKTITPGNQREFFAAYRDCDRVRGMVPYKGNTNEWGASTAGIGLGAQDAIKKGRVTVHKSGNGASAVLRALDKIT